MQFTDLPDDQLFQFCETLDINTLSNLAQTNDRLNYICKGILQKERERANSLIKELTGMWTERKARHGTVHIINDIGKFIEFKQDVIEKPFFPNCKHEGSFCVTLIRKNDFDSLEKLYSKLINSGMVRSYVFSY